MKIRFAPYSALIILPAFIALAALPAHAQTSDPGSTSNDAGKGKKVDTSHVKKVKHDANPTDSKPVKAGQYASESAAQAHCKGTVVWVDKDKFHHYAGTREFGKQPGDFECE